MKFSVSLVAIILLFFAGIFFVNEKFFGTQDDGGAESALTTESFEKVVVPTEDVINHQDTHKDNASDIKAVEPKDFSVPINLSLPFRTEDIDHNSGAVNPLGVVRSNQDEGGVGHSGIDIPLREGVDVFAVADGRVVLVKSAGDPWGGQAVFHLLKATNEGEGWGYIYEHIKPRADLKVNDLVKRGEIIGVKVAPTGFTAHFQMSHLFNDFQYIKDIQCWSDKLSTADSTKVNSWWATYRESGHLINSWETIIEEGKYPFRGLLDAEFSPNGLQLCYSPGTDVR